MPKLFDRYRTFFKWSGKEFHAAGPAQEKARLLYVDSRHLGTSRSPRVVERSWRRPSVLQDQIGLLQDWSQANRANGGLDLLMNHYSSVIWHCWFSHLPIEVPREIPRGCTNLMSTAESKCHQIYGQTKWQTSEKRAAIGRCSTLR